ncbi:MAG TPA: ATP-dependent DNA helicase [Thermoplasmata archaeon]|nr:ATP-dependent DNA helicase [Thermoplasmata archaeon]
MRHRLRSGVGDLETAPRAVRGPIHLRVARAPFLSTLYLQGGGPARSLGESPTAPTDRPPDSASVLFPYRPRPGQERILAEVSETARRGGSLLLDAATGSGKTVAVLAPLLEHAELADHRILYLVRTHAQEAQVLQETRAISHRLDHPILAVGLEGRQKRCLLLEGTAEMKGATAEEHGKLCADRKRATQRMFDEGALLGPVPDRPDAGPVDLADLDGCAYYAKVLQADHDRLAERFSENPATPSQFEEYCRSEDLCAYELAKRLAPRARLLTAPYVFFFHPHIRSSLLRWIGVGLDRIDLVVDEAHNLPEHLRDLASVALPEESIRRARNEIAERGDFAIPDGPSASHVLETVAAAVEELIEHHAPHDDGVLPPNALEDRLLEAFGGTSHRLDTWIGALVTWGEALREERRRHRHLPRSWVHAVGLALLSWPQLADPGYVKLATRTPRRALEAYALDASRSAEAVRSCHLSVHMSGTLAPLQEYRDSLGLGETARMFSIPSHFPSENRRLLYDPTSTTRFEELRADPESIPRIADRLTEVLQALPVRTAVFFPSFDLMDRVLAAGLQSQLPPTTVIETRRATMGDLWRSIEGFKRGSPEGVLLGVTGGRIAEGVDFPDEELEAVVVVGIPYPRPTAKREALRRYLDARTGHGWEFAVAAPAQRAILQALGRMIRSENDRGIGIVLDRRATAFAEALPGLAPLENLEAAARAFYGRRARLTRASGPSPEGLPLGSAKSPGGGNGSGSPP